MEIEHLRDDHVLHLTNITKDARVDQEGCESGLTGWFRKLLEPAQNCYHLAEDGHL